MAQERIGFVGLGLMGHGMAANIVAKGYGLTVYAHRNRAPVEDLVSKGASEAGSLAELAAASDIVFLCLTGSPQVAEVVAANPSEWERYVGGDDKLTGFFTGAVFTLEYFTNASLPVAGSWSSVRTAIGEGSRP